MQNLKKMLLMTLLVTSSGCSQLPDKPKGDLCVIDIRDQDLICVPMSVMTAPKTFKDFVKLVTSSSATHVPLSQADNYVAFSPDTYGNVEKYIKQLEEIAKNQCK